MNPSNPYKDWTEDQVCNEIERICGKDVWKRKDWIDYLEATVPELSEAFFDKIARGN